MSSMFGFQLNPDGVREGKKESMNLVWQGQRWGKLAERVRTRTLGSSRLCQWRDEARLASKRRKIEDEKADEVLRRKQDVLQSVEDDSSSEAEEDGTEQPEVPVGPLPSRKRML